MLVTAARAALPHLLARLAMSLAATSAVAQGRTMNVSGAATIGFSVVFEHRAPASAAGAIALHALSPHYPGVYPLLLPGLTMLGNARIDAAQVWLQSSSLVSSTGSATWRVAIPFDPAFVGVAFDVQSLDFDATTSTVQWAQSDAELTIASFAPPTQFNMVAIQPGTFSMGTNTGLAHEQPVHVVTLTRPFWIGRHEVTQAEYQSVMGNNPSYFQGASYPNSPQRPVDGVSWENAIAFCSARNATEAAAGRVPSGYEYRLPTEAEWEYCCRAGTTTDWSTGSSLLCGQANLSDCGPLSTTLVGSHPPNPWGLFDTYGNVWEWCLDRFASYPSGAVADPYNPNGLFVVMRGCSWFDAAIGCRSTSRGYNLPYGGGTTNGFRVVLAPTLVP